MLMVSVCQSLFRSAEPGAGVFVSDREVFS